MKKKTSIAIAVALVLALVVAMGTFVSFATDAGATPSADPVSTWDGTTVSTELKTDSDGAYLIQSAADLAYFAKSVSASNNYDGKTVKLTTDIAWNDTSDYASWSATNAPANSWTRIGWWNNGFAGTFDGQGHTVSGIYLLVNAEKDSNDVGLDNQGFFGSLELNAVVKNLNIKDSAYFGTSAAKWGLNMGAIVGVAASRDVSDYNIQTIENCHVSAVMDAQKTGIAGIVGSAHESTGKVIVKNCSFNGSISSSSNSAGLVGCAGGDLEIDNCFVTAPYSSCGTQVGGFVGNVTNNKSRTEGVVIKNSAYVGNLTSTSNTIGGMIGTMQINTKATIENCKMTGNIVSKWSAGGVIGSLYPNTSVVIRNTSMVGNVDGGTGPAGGFIGVVTEKNGSDPAVISITIDKCYHKGDVSASYSVGGLISWIPGGSKTCIITDTIHVGDVKYTGTGTWYFVGGLVGKSTANNTVTIKNSIVSGQLTNPTANNSGLVIANSGTTNLTVENCYYLAGVNPTTGGATTLAGATAKTEAELKALVLNGWTSVSGDYPTPCSNLPVPGAKTASVDFSAVVTLTGKTIAADQFTVNLFKADASFVPEATALKTAKNGSDGVADLGSVTLGEGTHYFVMKQVKEEVKGYTYDESVYNVAITVDNFGNIMSAATKKAGVEGTPTSFSFANKYTVSPSSLNLTAKVELDGRTLKAGEFTLAIYETGSDFAVPAASALKTAANDVEGNVYFTEVQDYSAAGTYYYVIKQIGDAVPGVTPEAVNYNVTVIVTDENSQLKASASAVKAGATDASDILYKNVYKAAATDLALSANVTLAGKNLTADLFSYSLYATGMDFKVSGDPIKTVKNADDGKIDLGTVTVSDKGTSYYVLKQNDFAAEGYSADATEYYITVTAVDDGNGKLSASYVASKKGEAGASALTFANSYEKPVTRIAKPADASVYEGKMSESLRTEGLNVYIDSAADLAKFADMVNNGTDFAGKNVVLTTDIVWNTGDAAQWANGVNLPGYTWACGSWIKRFAGTFDGQGHTIYGLYGKSDTDNFGFISAAKGTVTIKDLILANCAFVSTRDNKTANLGGVVGTIDICKLTVDNVYAEVFLSAPTGTRVGGILGYCHRLLDTEVTITDTVFAGSATGKNEVGGFIGYLTYTTAEEDKTVKLTIENCLNKGSVTGGLNVGGFVGISNDRILVNITDSVNAGLVTGTSKTGAIAGTCNAAPTLTDVYYLDVSAATAGTGLTATAVTAEKLYGDAAKTNLTGLDFEKNWVTVADDTPLPASVNAMVNPVTAGEGEEEGKEEAKEPQAVLPTVTPSKDASVYDGKKSEKLRTEGKTVYIDSAADLALFAEKVTNGNGYAGKTIVLTTDIIWNKGDADKWADGSVTPEYDWTCGKWGKFFQGTFDGQGHVISGLYNKSDSDNTGVFGAVGGKATIQNLAVVNSTFLCTRTSGNANMGLIGVSGEGATITVDNCFVDANFVSSGAGSVGGVLGALHVKNSSVMVTNSVFAGTSIGGGNVAGFVGRASANNDDESVEVTIENCLNVGTVIGTSNVSGFVGFTTKEIGTVKITNCINAGSVSGSSDNAVGAFFGSGTEKVTLKDCVYVIGTALKATGSDAKDGVVCVATASLLGDTAKSTLTNFDFKKEWTAVKDGYPLPTTVVKSFGAGTAENNPGTSDFVPVIFAVAGILSVGAALIVLRKKKVK